MPAPETHVAGNGSGRLRVESFGDANRAAVVALAREAWDRPTDDAYFAWRYAQCPTVEAAVALDGDRAVAMMFALRRQYVTPQGIIEFLEPFDWFAVERWRALGAGLRVVRHLMRGPRPLVALGGTEAATRLFARLGWRDVGRTTRYILPLTGQTLRRRGRSALVAGVFGLVGTAYFRPRPTAGGTLAIAPADADRSAIETLALSQPDHAPLRCLPSSGTMRWLESAPVAVGRFHTFEVRTSGALIGWATTREFLHRGLKFAEIQDFHLVPGAHGGYAELVRRLCEILATDHPDAIFASSTAPETTDALLAARFRSDQDDRVFVWWPSGPDLGSGPVHLNSSHADRAFFPLATEEEARQVTAARR